MEGQCGLPLTKIAFHLCVFAFSLLHCVCMLEPLGICDHIPEWASLEMQSSHLAMGNERLNHCD